MRIALVVLFLLCGVAAFAESQPPSPTPSKTIEKHENQPNQKNTNPQIADQFGTAITNHPKTDESKEKHENQPSPEWWLVYLTAALVLVTLGLAIYTAKLWHATKELAKDAKDTADRQATEMQDSLSISKEAASLTKDSVDLARKEFISSHRPRLVIRSATIKPYGFPVQSEPIQIEAVVVNVGNTEAEIVESNIAALITSPGFDARTPYGPITDNINGVKLVPGGAYTFCFTSEKLDIKNHPSVLVQIERGEKVIYFFGFAMYRDGMGNIRRIAFCRKYNSETERFDQTNDPDYEYAD